MAWSVRAQHACLPRALLSTYLTPHSLSPGPKDLELFAGALAPGEPLFATEVTTIQGRRRLLTGSAFRWDTEQSPPGTWRAAGVHPS